MRTYKSISELVGGTPLLEPVNYARYHAIEAKLLIKLEYFNPAGSVKDRAALYMIEDAEKRGALKRGGAIIEPTSGNTGIALAAIAAAKGYKLIATMPDTMSKERRSILAAYGAEIVLTDGKKGMTGAIEKARELERALPDAIVMGQFDNPANPQAHFETTGPEIWRDTDGKVDVLVAGVGTGGTLSGAGAFLKSKNKNICVVAVEPSGSPVLSEGKAGAHGIQGLGAGFVPKTLHTRVYDRVTTVSDDDAFAAAKQLGKSDGILVGISSGAALFAATQLAKENSNRDKIVVAILPDSADRYYSTKLFD